MTCRTHPRILVTVALLGIAGATGCTRATDECSVADTRQQKSQGAPSPDLSGCKRTGVASFYAKKFNGRKMADGTRMDPDADNAASKTLPLGTTATVKNVDTGQSAKVTIQDRGPHVPGRIIDLSPATAREIGLDADKGIARVEVTPIKVPLPDGGVKRGIATDDDDSKAH